MANMTGGNPPNKSVSVSGVGSNMTKTSGESSAIREISEKNHPCGTTEAQKAIRSISNMGPSPSGKSQSKP